MVTVSLRMPERLASEVAAAACRIGVSRSALIRDAVEAFLVAEETERPRSVLALAADLVGSYEGSADLSVNKEYLQGYGE